jgi:hypothetical protein
MRIFEEEERGESGVRRVKTTRGRIDSNPETRPAPPPRPLHRTTGAGTTGGTARPRPAASPPRSAAGPSPRYMCGGPVSRAWQTLLAAS